MNRPLWLAQKNEVCSLIKKISDYYGGDEIDWLREYAREVIEANSSEMQNALDCFRDLSRQVDNKIIKVDKVQGRST
jgi:hypothetical protein